MDRGERTKGGGFSISEPFAYLATSIDAAVRPDGASLGCVDWTRRYRNGTHTMRRTKASLIYRRTKNLRAVRLLLGHTKLESTVRYLGIEVDDALEMAEQTEV
jgi:hypothetical protein